MDINCKFIYTDNVDSKEKLERAGFRLFKEVDGKLWVFINNSSLHFSKSDDMIYSDVVTF